MTPALDRDRWSAVRRRDPRLDGVFVYAVRSTGVYCRPSCPARRPRRDRVAFFATPDEAERSGFRACRRCRPRAAERTTAGEAAVARARAILEAHLDGGEPGGVPLAALARAAGASPFHLQRTFKRVLGVSPKRYLDAGRIERFKRRTKEGDSVTTATYAAGFGSSRALYEGARAGLGMTPGRYRRGGRGLRIGYAIVDTALGRALVAATERGVCAVALGESDGELAAGLAREFPAAAIERDDAPLAPLVRAAVRALDGRSPGAPVPLDLRGTEFQLRVWDALRRIPRGRTRTYGEVAAALGAPRAARAVGRACAANRVAGLVPCHRAVPKAGAPGGWRWGPGRKRRLLGREARGG